MARRSPLACLAIALVIALMAAVPTALAIPRYPAKTGLPVSDTANILSQQTVRDLSTFHEILKNRTGVGLWVVSVHFLDGVNAEEFARQVFAQWELGADDLLLLLSAGDEAYATMAGSSLEKGLPAGSRQLLLSTYFLADFQQDRYDAALAAFIPQLASSLGKQYGASVPVNNLFGLPAASPAPPATVRPSGGDFWMNYLPGGGIELFSNQDGQENSIRIQRERESGFSVGSLAILLLLFFLIFGSRRRRPGERAGCMGCGCGPLGWIAAALGIGGLIRRRR